MTYLSFAFCVEQELYHANRLTTAGDRTLTGEREWRSGYEYETRVI